MAIQALLFRTEAEIKVEKILNSWEDRRNQELLEEMNGSYCARHQLSILHKNSFVARPGESEEVFQERTCLIEFSRATTHRSRMTERRGLRRIKFDDYRQSWVRIGAARARTNRKLMSETL